MSMPTYQDPPDFVSPFVCAQDAYDLRLQGLPWRVRLVSTQGGSNKFWQMESLPQVQVKISWGKRGSKGQSQTKAWAEAFKRLELKLRSNKGYAYCHDMVSMGEWLFQWRKRGAAKAFVKLPPLLGPFGMIRTLQVQPGGEAQARDRGGRLLMVVTMNGFETLKRYPQINVVP